LAATPDIDDRVHQRPGSFPTLSPRIEERGIARCTQFVQERGVGAGGVGPSPKSSFAIKSEIHR